MTKEVRRACRHEDDLSLIMFDVDHFKDFNDTYGHPAGDYVLREIARLGAEHFREEDFFARYGGEEFAVILPATSEEHAEDAAQRFRKLIEDHEFEYEGQKFKVTISLGVAAFIPVYTKAADLVKRADHLLYAAKREGRNTVITYVYALENGL